ncbi:AAEL012933-PA [Aedes aegypti]|uniref:AAEL012933-PA n=1 Tax=Aedes aegypti TaxID=7159 RepID=Q16KM8_AEDAE|nr:AAEL012933-PA [Aedes aegypti]
MNINFLIDLARHGPFQAADVHTVPYREPTPDPSIDVKPGNPVKAGTSLAVLIVMKMEHVLKAASDGIVKAVSNPEGSNVQKGAALIAFESN